MTTLIHLDTDIGGDTDDLCALIFLLGLADVEVIGITTSAEVDGWRAGFARAALRLAGREDIPVAAGAAGSLGGFAHQPGIGDPDRYWPEWVIPAPGPPGAALDLLFKSIGRGATVVAVGPFTNLALAETLRPGLLSNTEVVLMGGMIGPLGPGLPDWGVDFDWNVQTDTTAAGIVFERADPLLVPLNVSVHVGLHGAHLPALHASGPLGSLLAVQAQRYAEDDGLRDLAQRHPALPPDLLNFQHDALACATAAGWDGVTVETMPLLPGKHGRWLTFTRARDGRATRVIVAVDSERFQADWLAAVQRADRRTR